MGTVGTPAMAGGSREWKERRGEGKRYVSGHWGERRGSKGENSYLLSGRREVKSLTAAPIMWSEKGCVATPLNSLCKCPCIHSWPCQGDDYWGWHRCDYVILLLVLKLNLAWNRPIFFLFPKITFGSMWRWQGISLHTKTLRVPPPWAAMCHFQSSGLRC